MQQWINSKHGCLHRVPTQRQTVNYFSEEYISFLWLIGYLNFYFYWRSHSNEFLCAITRLKPVVTYQFFLKPYVWWVNMAVLSTPEPCPGYQTTSSSPPMQTPRTWSQGSTGPEPDGRRKSHLPGVSQGCVVTSVDPAMLRGCAEVNVSHPRAEEEEPRDTRRLWCAGALGQLHPPAPAGDQGMVPCEGEHPAGERGSDWRVGKYNLYSVFNEAFLIR